jgi:hypothetical protein
MSTIRFYLFLFAFFLNAYSCLLLENVIHKATHADYFLDYVIHLLKLFHLDNISFYRVHM